MDTPTLSYRKGHGEVVVDLDRLIASRMLVQANSGGGKSRALRQLLEETHGRVQHLVLDPEGEFASLREHFDYVLAGKDADVAATPKTARLLCRRLVELGASAVIDLYDLSLQERREFVKLFVTELMALPRALWRPILVVIDEAHLFVPERGSGESQSTEAVISLCTQGRKRGFCAVLATQRISKLHKDAAAELLNKLIGRTGLDVDMKRAGDELGLDKDGRRALATLRPGQFYAYGPAISNEIRIVRTGDVITTHPEAGKLGAAPPPAPAKVRAMLAQLADLPKEAEEEARSMEELQRQLRDTQAKLRRAEKVGVERVVEMPVVDERAISRAVAAAIKPYQDKLTRIRRQWPKFETAMHAVVDAVAVAKELSEAETTEDSRAEVQVGNHEQGTGANQASVSAVGRSSRAPVRPIATSSLELSAGVSRPQQRMLNALASLAVLGLEPAPRSTVAVLSDQSPRSSGFEKNMSTLRSAGLISYPTSDHMQLTDAGRAAAIADATITSLADLHASWSNKVSRPQWRMCEVLIGVYPDAMERAALAAETGQSVRSSGFEKNLSTLRSLGLIDYPSSSEAVATTLLMPEDLQ